MRGTLIPCWYHWHLISSSPLSHFHPPPVCMSLYMTRVGLVHKSKIKNAEKKNIKGGVVNAGRVDACSVQGAWCCFSWLVFGKDVG